MDPLTSIIALLRPRAVQSKVISGAGRWGVRYAAHGHPGFCLVLDGGCWLDVDGAGPQRLEAGDFVLLPATPGFVMTSHPDVRPAQVEPGPGDEVRHGPASAEVNLRMLGGYFRLDPTNASLLQRLLPVMVHIRRGTVRLRRLARLIRSEATRQRPGRDLILERLAEVLLVEALRWRPTP
ncbi:MAG: AraC family transcriptional regulator, partial [Myxococcales bacterium]